MVLQLGSSPAPYVATFGLVYLSDYKRECQIALYRIIYLLWNIDEHLSIRADPFIIQVDHCLLVVFSCLSASAKAR